MNSTLIDSNIDEWVETSSNFSVDDYLEQHLGPKHLPQSIVIPLTVVYVLIFLSGLVGNFCVCLVIIKKTSMQTSTNYYLFSLALSDLLLLIFGLPNDLRLFWQQYPWVLGEVMCRARALISEMTNYASVLTIVAFTVERYIAICHPLLSQTTSSLSRVTVVIATNWIVAAISATPFAILTSVHYIDYPPGSKRYIRESAFCMMPTNAKENPHFRPLLCFSSLAFFFIPMTLIVILYIKIGITLRKSASQPNECSSLKSEGKPSSRKVIIKMLVAVVIAFIICWAPFHAQRLLFVYAEARHWPIALRRVNEILYFAGCLYYFNTTINPILYNVMSAKYRDAFREILCESCPRLALCRCASSSTSPSAIHCGVDVNKSLRYSQRRYSTTLDTCTFGDDLDLIVGVPPPPPSSPPILEKTKELPVNAVTNGAKLLKATSSSSSSERVLENGCQKKHWHVTGIQNLGFFRNEMKNNFKSEHCYICSKSNCLSKNEIDSDEKFKNQIQIPYFNRIKAHNSETSV